MASKSLVSVLLLLLVFVAEKNHLDRVGGTDSWPGPPTTVGSHSASGIQRLGGGTGPGIGPPHSVHIALLFVAGLNFDTCKPRKRLGKCSPSGYVRGKSSNCNKENYSDCCVDGKMYPQYHCSPPITGDTSAAMTINSFVQGGDGGGPSECDNKYHSDNELVLVALSTGWYNGGSRCLNNIRINANGRSVLAKVVDECDSVNGCYSDHDFQPPCPNNIADASPAVWKALGIPKSQIEDYDITWSDA